MPSSILYRRPLDERTTRFAIDVRTFTQKLSGVPQLVHDLEALLESSGGIGANYIEARDAMTTKAFCFRMKMCRKESREAFYWLSLVRQALPTKTLRKKCDALLLESEEFIRIFSTIARKCGDVKKKEEVKV